jgi:hypothetical protein
MLLDQQVHIVLVVQLQTSRNWTIKHPEILSFPTKKLASRTVELSCGFSWCVLVFLASFLDATIIWVRSQGINKEKHNNGQEVFVSTNGTEAAG